MLLESDRMMNAYFREFYSEKDVIMEERRLSENSPGYFFQEQVNAAFFAASPYHWEVIGWMDDIRKMTKKDLVDFHYTYYVPNNAVAVYVGDIDPAAIIALAEKYFGRIPRGPDLEPVRTMEPPQYSEKRLYGEGPAPTSLTLMFHIPAEGHVDSAPLSVLADILGSGGGGRGGMRGGPGGGGGSGRLYKSLVRDKELAVSVSAFSRPMWYAGAFQFRAVPRLDKNVQPETLEQEIWNEIEKVKNRSESAFIRSLQSASGIASRLGRAELHRGWRSILTDLEAVKAVTSDDIKRVAAIYFVKDNSLAAVYKRKTGR